MKMTKHILKIIWAQRKSNAWIYAELAIVACVLWLMLDKLYVDFRTFYSPSGYDISDTWRFKPAALDPLSPAYIPEDEGRGDPTSDLLRLADNIRRHPMVDGVCFTYYSCPYSFGNSWTNIRPVDGDTTAAASRSFQLRRVSPEYFEVFRVRDINGNIIPSALFTGTTNPIVVTRDLAETFFHEKSATGKRILYDGSDEILTILATSQPVRSSDFDRSEPGIFTVMTGELMINTVSSFGADNAEICVRMKKAYTKDEMYALLSGMSGQLTVNNLTVYGVEAVSSFRDYLLKDALEARRNQLSLMVFLLVNVFFGIIGTFWLRTQYRRGETGIRTALGASRAALAGYLYVEGILLLMLTMPVTLAFATHVIYAGIPDAYRLPLTPTRFILACGGTYLLLAGMISLGIYFPARKTIRLAPAEALRYE
jgi:hypothetical protein